MDLGGYYLTDNLTNKFQFLVPTNGQYTIPPGGFLLVWADGEATQNATNRADLHASFSLSKNGEAIGIFAANGTAIDALTFGAQITDVSQGRFSDGAAGIFTMPTCTPRTNNIIPNTAPVLNPIANQFTYAGLSVHFTATATDTQSAVQSLSFSLLSGPSGATIHPTSGAFNWSVPSETTPGTNLVALRVLDNGTPPLNDDKTFSVIVRPLPQIASLITGNQLQLSWPATEMGWRLEAQTNSLNVGLNATWFPVSNSTSTNQLYIPISATNSSVFFRLVSP